MYLYSLKDLSINRGAYKDFEDSIYHCISAYGATSAALKWTFSYESTSRTKPKGVTYAATFSGSSNSSCKSNTQTFTN